MRQEVISGWGGCPSIRVNLHEIRSSQDISSALEGSSSLTLRGRGRSYGESSLGNQVMITTKMDRLLTFDEKTGILECESGVCLEDLIRVFVPKGWFVPVSELLDYIIKKRGK